MYNAKAAGLCQMLLSTVILWAANAPLQAQTVLFAHQAPASANQPFSRFDESLIEAAEQLLVLPSTITASGVVKPSVNEAPGSTHDLLIELRPHPLLVSGSTLASARLDLLRPAIEPILRIRGVPTELAAVIMVESGGRSTALSPKGARGLWQLMPETARRYGLRVNEIQDDRVDLLKSTDAAARYLHDLYAQFGDWRLALAAYNTGEANVGAAILRAHTQDLDQLVNLRILPFETRNYVPRVLATAQSLGQPLILREDQTSSRAITVFAVSDH